MTDPFSPAAMEGEPGGSPDPTPPRACCAPCAGEPPYHVPNFRLRRVYPRVCGGTFVPGDVAFNPGVGAHIGVGFGSGGGVVGPVTPVAVIECGEQATLRARMQGFATPDKAGARGPMPPDRYTHCQPRRPAERITPTTHRHYRTVVDRLRSRDHPIRLPSDPATLRAAPPCPTRRLPASHRRTRLPRARPQSPQPYSPPPMARSVRGGIINNCLLRDDTRRRLVR